MDVFNKKTNCSGCYACVNICPEECIRMESDSEGFWYPAIDLKKCIHCNECEFHCPMLNMNKKSNAPAAYAAVNKDDSIRRTSSSGGIFYLLAENIIKSGGIVYGAAFNKNHMVEHIGVHSLDELYRLQGSKYVQSKIGYVYSEIKKELENGRLVYFSGTPCQVDALILFLEKNYDNLICQDIVCHGVPSPYIWKHYLQQFSLENDAEILFRDKSTGWESYSFVINQNKKFKQRASDNLYMRSFIQNLCLRPSCYNCCSKGTYRKSDITLGDFWGVENICPDMNDNKGTSLVLVNTEKGEKIFDQVKERTYITRVESGKALENNPAFSKSAQLPEKRTDFMKEIYKNSFDKVAKKYVRDPFFLRIKILIYRFLFEKNKNSFSL